MIMKMDNENMTIIKRVIVVLGMHRSGTSAITRSLQVLGVGLGDNLHPAGFDNPKGFWEDRDCIAINEELLDRLGSAYDRLGLAWNPSIEDPEISPLYIKAIRLVSDSVSKNHGIWGVKDPRMCRLLGFWKSVFLACGCDASFIISLRNPISVAESLAIRNKIQAEKSYFLWLQHMVPLILETREENRVVIDYDLMIEVPEEQITRIASHLRIPFNTKDNESLKDFSKNFLDDNLRHSTYTLPQVSMDARLPQDALKAYSLLLRVARDEISIDSDEVQSGFEQIASNLRAYSPAFAYINALEEKHSDFYHTIADKDENIAEKEQSVQVLTAQVAEKEQVVQVLTAQVAEKEQSLQAQLAQVAEREQSVQALSAQLREITISKAWRVAMTLRNIRVFLLPPEGWRLRLSRKILPFQLFLNTIRRTYKINRNLALIRHSDLFDPARYLAENPDVAESGMDPARHYLLFGGFEGQDPSATFSSKWYLETYPDVVAAGMNPMVHYLRHGKSEGRTLLQGQNNVVLHKSGDGMLFLKRFAHYLRRGLTVWKKEGFKEAWRRTNRKLENTNIAEFFLNEANDQVFPEVSIVIPVFNALPMTQACLASLFLETKNINFEIIMIDNASTDGTSKWLAAQQTAHPNLKLFRMDHNIGFGPAVNIGLQHSKGKFLVILNNDTLLAPSWLDNLLSVVEKDPSVGIVSPVTNYVGEGPQIDSSAQNLSADPVAIAQHAKSVSERMDVFYEPNRLVFFCVLIRRELVDLIGYLDEGYEKGNFEDDDYCLRTRMAGYRLAIARNALVYHHGTATFKSNRISHNQWMEINRGRFYRKAGRIATSSRPWMPTLSKRKVSVIVRTKDRPLLLRKALTSLANQTFRDFEVVLINDGGEDVSSIVASFETHFPITYVHHIKSKGRTTAINAGLKNANGKWIAYLDDDDILYPWHFEALLQAAEINSAKVVYSDYNRALIAVSDAIFPIRLIGIPPFEYSRSELLINNYIPIHSYLHLRDCIDETGAWNESLDRLEDYEFLLRLSAICDFQHVKKVTCEYRYYLDIDSSITSNGRKEYQTALQKIYEAFPVKDVGLLYARQESMEGLNWQIQKIDEITKGSTTKNDDIGNIRREIIRMVVGI